MAPKNGTIQFGILMIPYQTLDVAGPIDLLSCSSKQMLASEGWKHFLRAEFQRSPQGKGEEEDYVNLGERGVDIEFHHINNTMDPVSLTAGMISVPTTTCKDCPELDYLLVGGPDPSKNHLVGDFEWFLKKHVEAGKGLFMTCTGAAAIASSGVLDGKAATTNHGVLGFVEEKFPNVRWQREQWVADGNIWSAGGACAGMDMMAHWIAENYDADVVKCGREMLDFVPRGLDKKLVE